MTARRLQLWWKRGRREWAASLIGVALLLAAIVTTLVWWSRQHEGGDNPAELVKLTLVENAQQNGAVCLDGSSPGYHLRRGFGSGSDKWVVHLEGGGWCNTVASCFYRKLTALGSSKYMQHQVIFEGILSNEESENPDFFNWNLVKVRYCDGASFSGDVDSQYQIGTKLFFRGQRIWKAVMNALLSEGLTNAKQALLTGCSAGGLATFIHCDEFRDLLPKSAIVKCFADGGFFLDESDVSGRRAMQSLYKDVLSLQNVGRNLRKDCITRNNEQSHCFFPQELIKYIKTPFFVLNSAYDWWQIQNVLVPQASDPNQEWQKCRRNIFHCTPKQLQTLHGFRESLLNSLSDFRQKGGNMFISSCFAHCQTMSSTTWHSPDSPRINNKTIAESVGDWYFDRGTVQAMDCRFPCNPTCHNYVFH